MRAANKSFTAGDDLLGGHDRAVVRTLVLRCVSGAGAGLIADIAVLLVLVESAGLAYLPASVLGFAAGLATFYALVVESRPITPDRGPTADLPILTGIALAGLGLTVLAMLVLVETIGLGYLEAKALTAFATAAFAFAALGDVIFGHQPAGRGPPR